MKLATRHKFIIFAAIIGAISSLLVPRLIRAQLPPQLGVTFSPLYAGYLDYDWRVAYSEMLSDLQVKNIRIPVYWDKIEPKQGEFDFSEVDWQLDEAEKHDAKVILAIGRKVPRWPECHIPDWAEGGENDTDEQFNRGLAREQTLTMIDAIVNRYKNRPSLDAWQVENEPLLPFGDCKGFDLRRILSEISHINQLDPQHDIILTESGELSPWIFGALFADRVGISMYLTVWNDTFGYFEWPHPPERYSLQANALRFFPARAFVSELQTEPWFMRDVKLTTIGDQMTIFPAKRINTMVSYAQLAGFREVYLWGVEWWYYMKIQGYPEYWEAAKEEFR